MKFKVVFSNELPFMIQLPSGEYKIKIAENSISKDMILNLSDKIFRLHINPFPNEKMENYSEGTSEELEELVVRNNISNYAFEKLKSYVTCIVEKELKFSEDMYEDISKEKIVEWLKGRIIRENKDIIPVEKLDEVANDKYKLYNTEQLKNVKLNYLIYKEINRVSNENIYSYYIALNKFIKQYSFIRNDFFVNTLTVHTLKGTYYQQYVDDQLYDQIKFAGKVPTILPKKQWMAELEEKSLEQLKQRLIDNDNIPFENSLILVARNLIERGEYRSAILEASAALEVAVEKKIVGKMKLKGKSEDEINDYLKETEVKFAKRCNKQLEQCTGKSFINDNNKLWVKIDSHRKNYRHKIIHSSLEPSPFGIEEIIDDYQEAIKYVQSL